MKLKFLVLLSLLYTCTVSAQLLITPGAQFSIGGNTQLTLQNTDLVNNGSLTSGSSIVSFTGNTSSSISGSQPVQFNELEMNKTANSSVILQRAIDVTQRLLFTSGFLNLNGFNTDLGTTGHLDGEQENTRIIGPNGGEVLFNVNLNAPTGSNPANLRLFITSGQNLGNVTIKRGHQSQANANGTGSSILRYYDIIPANNANLNATLRINYFDGELNNLVENTLELFQKQTNNSWLDIGVTLKDAALNFAEKNTIGSFNRFTLSSFGNILPVRFISFNANCTGDKVVLNWKTAQEENSSHFGVERSLDGIRWTVIGNLSASGNSSTERSYSFEDNIPVQNSFYRIAEFDINGNVQYSSTEHPSCVATDVFNLWPNPVRDVAFINIVTANRSTALIKIFDSKGALVKLQEATLTPGSNRLSVDVKSFANGVYHFSVEWNNGQMKRAVQVLKQ